MKPNKDNKWYNSIGYGYGNGFGNGYGYGYGVGYDIFLQNKGGNKTINYINRKGFIDTETIKNKTKINQNTNNLYTNQFLGELLW